MDEVLWVARRGHRHAKKAIKKAKKQIREDLVEYLWKVKQDFIEYLDNYFGGENESSQSN